MATPGIPAIFPGSFIVDQRRSYSLEEVISNVDPFVQQTQLRTWTVIVENADPEIIDRFQRELTRFGLKYTRTDPRVYEIVLPIRVDNALTPKEFILGAVRPFSTRVNPQFVEINKALPLWQVFASATPAKATSENLVKTRPESSARAKSENPAKPESSAEIGWTLTLDQEYLASTHIPTNFIQNVLQALGFDLVTVTPEAITVTYPGDREPQDYALEQYRRNRARFMAVKLSEAQIQTVLDRIPTVAAAFKETAESIRQSIQRVLRLQLLEIKIAPIAFEMMVDQIVFDFERKRIAPGTMVGAILADSLGQPITQLALNSFHSAGSVRSVSSGIEAINELLNVSKVRKHESCTIYFKETLNYEQTMAKRVPMVGLTIENLLVDAPQIETPETFGLTWWHSQYEASTGLSYQTVSGRAISEASWVMRLPLNVNLMFAHRITMADVVRALFSQEAPFFPIPSPISLGLLDLIPIERAGAVQWSPRETPEQARP